MCVFFNTIGFGYNTRVRHNEEHLSLYICTSACSAWISEHLCQESSPRVNLKSGTAILSCPCFSLFKGKAGANRIIPKADRCQSHPSLNLKVWWDQCRQGDLFQIGPSSAEISHQTVFATPVAMLVERRKPCSQERRKTLHWPGYPCCWNTSRYDNSCWKETKAWKGAKGTQNRDE